MMTAMRALPLLALLALLALLVLAACSSSTSIATGVVAGHVLALPCTPVQYVNQSPCLGLPVAGARINFTSPTDSVSVTTDKQGAYSLSLPAGTYQATLEAHPPFGVSRHSTLTLKANSTSTLDFHIDSGIR